MIIYGFSKLLREKDEVAYIGDDINKEMAGFSACPKMRNNVLVKIFL